MKRRTFYIPLLAFLLSLPVLAHDGGHGPKLNDQPLEGGLKVVPVVDAKDAKAGAAAKLVYKSELVANSDGTLALYVYDEDMRPIASNKFGKTAEVQIGPMRKNPKWKTEHFKLEQKGNHFVGTAPAIKLKPYYVEITLTEGDRKLLTAYENLDWSPKK